MEGNELYNPTLADKVIRYFKQKIRTYLFENNKVEYQLATKEDFEEALKENKEYIQQQRKLQLNNSLSNEEYVFNGDLFDSQAYLNYYVAYRHLLKKYEAKAKATTTSNKKSKLNLFVLSQSAFMLSISEFQHAIIFGEIKRSFIEDIIDEKMREYPINFRKLDIKDKSVSIPVKIEMLTFSDNSVILNMSFENSVLDDYLQLMNAEKDNFYRFIHENSTMLQDSIRAMSEQRNNEAFSLEKEVYEQQRTETLKMVNFVYHNTYQMIIENLENQIFTHICDLKTLFQNLVNIKSVGQFNGKVRHNPTTDDVYKFIKANRMIVTLMPRKQ